MISRDDEKRILAEYQSLLDAEQEALRGDEERVEKRRAGVENLEGIVHGLASRVGGPKAAEGIIFGGRGSGKSGTLFLGTGISVRNGQPTLTALVRAVMDDGEARNVNDLIDALRERDELPEDEGPTLKQKLANRFVELTQQKYLERRGRGVYQLASVEAHENGAERRSPNPPVGSEGPNPGPSQAPEPPDEEVISPRPGHPNYMERLPVR